MSTPPKSLLRRLIGNQNSQPEFDAGDMGTAIGLEYSLDQPPLPAPSIKLPATGERKRWFARKPSN
ncbi:hypothetical protein [Ideonella sp.]|uniref:hypothetical protein n=1 Tax=Ideonella sp. TaxID=1929293 RepID=UPI003BB5008B